MIGRGAAVFDVPPWPLQGHGAVVAGLLRAARDGRLPHALLVSGREGVGKFRAAAALAQGLLCATGRDDGAPCGSCGPCRRFLSGNHPDVHFVDPLAEGEDVLKIGRVTPREGGPEETIHGFLSLRPMESGWRIVVVRDAERAVVEAQNAILKTLEEPGDSVLLVLVTHRPEVLLSTIRSRCIQVRCAPLTRAETGAALDAAPGARAALAGEDAERLARWSGGSPGLALRLARERAGLVRDVLVERMRGARSAHASALLISDVDADVPGRTPAAARRAFARSVLEQGLAVLGDLTRAAGGVAPDDLPHGDLVALVDEAPWLGRSAWLEDGVDALLAGVADLGRNLDAEGVLERALVSLQPPGQPARPAPRVSP